MIACSVRIKRKAIAAIKTAQAITVLTASVNGETDTNPATKSIAKPDCSIAMAENRWANRHLSSDFIDEEVRYPYRKLIFFGGKMYEIIEVIAKIPPVITMINKAVLSECILFNR